ncbi:hypothetical protein EVAR_50491_1 [Eumeta japonica]|uniref:Uncharacterized protein n=1 Tax=Eumeta variegata TaxID=151549 RepID=A0A4C1XRU0_EUMVA|nr:hypothetical protein EVAR_50491_1 [Eumeta japonica]
MRPRHPLRARRPALPAPAVRVGPRRTDKHAARVLDKRSLFTLAAARARTCRGRFFVGSGDRQTSFRPWLWTQNAFLDLVCRPITLSTMTAVAIPYSVLIQTVFLMPICLTLDSDLGSVFYSGPDFDLRTFRFCSRNVILYMTRHGGVRYGGRNRVNECTNCFFFLSMDFDIAVSPGRAAPAQRPQAPSRSDSGESERCRRAKKNCAECRMTVGTPPILCAYTLIRHSVVPTPL